MPPRADLLPGTLDVLILKAVSLGPLHGYGVLLRIEQMTNGALLVGAQRHVYVAETDAQAIAEARPAYKVWYDNLTHLWRQFNSIPMRFSETLDKARENDASIVGSPATVRAEIERHLAETGCNYFVGRFVYGNLGNTAPSTIFDSRAWSLPPGPLVAVSSLSAKVASSALFTIRAASPHPMCSSISTPESSTAPGFAWFLPVYFGAVPWVASNMAARSPMLAPAARPMPPVIAAAASER